jgi:hypothetical protein
MTDVNVLDAIRRRRPYVVSDDHHKTERSSRLQAIIDAPSDQPARAGRSITPAGWSQTADLRKCRLAA